MPIEGYASQMAPMLVGGAAPAPPRPMPEMNPWHVGKLLMGGAEEREKIVGQYGYDTSVNVLNHAINRAKQDIAGASSEADRKRRQEYHDFIMDYRNELLGRQSM